MFAIIHPKLVEEAIADGKENLPKFRKVIQYCGFEDSVVNHTQLLKLIKKENLTSGALERLTDKSPLSHRIFTVQCMSEVEVLQLSFEHMTTLKKDFPLNMRKLIKQNVQQTMSVLCQLVHMIHSFDKPRNLSNDFWTSKDTSNELLYQKALEGKK